jgi:hypothetical protein
MIHRRNPSNELFLGDRRIGSHADGCSDLGDGCTEADRDADGHRPAQVCRRKDVGKVALSQTRSGVSLKLSLKGLSPGDHAFSLIEQPTKFDLAILLRPPGT